MKRVSTLTMLAASAAVFAAACSPTSHEAQEVNSDNSQDAIGLGIEVPDFSVPQAPPSSSSAVLPCNSYDGSIYQDCPDLQSVGEIASRAVTMDDEQLNQLLDRVMPAPEPQEQEPTLRDRDDPNPQP